MNKGAYYDLVVAKNGEKSILCVAPFCSGINKGDFIEVDGGCVEVVCSCTVARGSDMWEFIKRIYGDAEPMRITVVYEKNVINWEDEDDA